MIIHKKATTQQKLIAPIIFMPYKDSNAMMRVVKVVSLGAAVCITVSCIHRSQTYSFLCISR